VIDPRVIVTLGRFSMAKWFPGEKISRIHGQPRWVGGRLIVPMMHPAAALHQVQNRQLVPTYVGALHNSRMSNDTDATPRLEIPVHGAYRGFPRFLLAHTVSRSRRVSSGE